MSQQVTSLYSLLNERLLNNSQDLAVISGKESLSWGALSEKINEWERLYRSLNLSQNVPIIIYGHKQIEFLVAIYASLLYKIPFIPIDVVYPLERLSEISEIAGVPYYYDCGVNAFINTHNEEKTLQEQDLAYIMFTSGSTGKPKGVQIGREAIVSLMNSMLHDFDLGEKPIFMNQAPFSFDLSMYEVLGNLAFGGTCVLSSLSAISDRKSWYDYLNETKANVWVSTPSFVYQQFVYEEFNAQELPHLKVFLFCGEPLSRTIAKKLLTLFPGSRILNTYGPTEATVATTFIEITEDIIESNKDLSLPIGKPMYGTEVFLDDGEIIISGSNVMRGYLGLEEENKLKLGLISGYEKLSFRTGDLGLVQNGLLYCLGRMDSQIKLNGYRIELREIENRILALPEVTSVHILPLKKTDGTIVRLVGFCISTLSEHEILSSLNGLLPSYMIPSQIVLIDEIPMTINGKIDSKELLNYLKRVRK